MARAATKTSATSKRTTNVDEIIEQEVKVEETNIKEDQNPVELQTGISAENYNYEALLKRVDELTKKVEIANSIPSVYSPMINLERDIPVVNMSTGTLNLCTEGKGNGTCYKFEKFNQILDIPFGDLKAIVQNNQRFANQGYFYIADEEAVKALRKSNEYKRIIPPETISKIFQYDANKVIDIYKMAPKGQQDLIIQMIVDKRLNAEKVDANIMIELGRLAKVDFLNMEPLDLGKDKE